MPKVPIPNQPSFVFSYTALTINIRGAVVNNKNKMAAVHVYGRLLSGTRSISLIPLHWTGLSHKGRIFLHGYFLTAYTPFAATRFRIPLIVSIWKIYLGYCNVVANMTETLAEVAVRANSDIELDSLSTSYIQFDDGADSYDSLVGHFEVVNVSGTRHVMSTTLEEKTKGAKLMAWPILNMKKALYTAFNLPIISDKKFKATINPQPIERTRITKFGVHPSILMGKMHRLYAHIVEHILDKTHKMHAHVSVSSVEKQHKMTAHGLQNQVTHIGKLSTSLIRQRTEHIGKGLLHLHRRSIIALHRTKVHVVEKYIEGILGYIRWLISRHPITSISSAKVRLSRMEQAASVKSTLHSSVSSKAMLALNILTKQVSKLLKVQAVNMKDSRTLQAHTQSISSKSIVSAIGTGWQEIKDKLINVVPAPLLSQDSGLRFNYTNREESIDVSFNTLPLLAERSMLFKPVDVPQLKWLNIMVTVLHTETLVFINSAIAELVNETTVRVSTFGHETISLLQWYLHGGNVYTEGNGNEVIFDLGEASDGSNIGTIPPIPSRYWSGGYVEDPFKGVGYKPSSESTGYVSPSVNKWLAGSKMYWGKATEPFQEE